jgi:hypothetical protein
MRRERAWQKCVDVPKAMGDQPNKRNELAAPCRAGCTGAKAYKLLINLGGSARIWGVSVPDNMSGRTSHNERAVRQKNVPAACCRLEGTYSNAYKLLIELHEIACTYGVSAPNKCPHVPLAMSEQTSKRKDWSISAHH